MIQTNSQIARVLIPAMLLSSQWVQAQSQSADDEAAEQDQSGEVEEVLTLGTRRQGDYTFITEDTEKLVEMPGSLGDPLAAIFALPGVIYAGGQTEEPAVRGSSPSDNAYIVDFMPAGYIFHDFGVSIFSEFILHDFQMYSAGFGPEYGNATGAQFDVALRQPENKPTSAVIDLSMLRSGVFLESGVTENSAFYLSARRSFLDLFVNEEDFSDDGIEVQKIPRDSDYLFKYSWQPADAHRLSFTANGAQEEAEAAFTEESELARSNPDFAGDARLESDYNGQNVLYEFFGDDGSEAKLGAGQFSSQENLYWGDDYVNEVNLTQQTVRGRYSRPLGNQFGLAVGGEYADKQYEYYLRQILFVCTEFEPDCEETRRDLIEEDGGFDVAEAFYYINATWMPNDAFTLDVGLQQQHNDYTEESFTHPRIAAALRVAERTTLTAKAGSYNRFPDIGTVTVETGNPQLASPRADHFTFGVIQDFDDDWSLSVETYYKTMSNLPLALSEDDPDGDLRYVADTEGTAYGVDVMLNKNLTDSWYGWVSLSYAKSDRTNTRTDQTEEYFLDTPLILNWVVNWQATSRFNIGWRWSIRSGSAYTPIVGVKENPYFEDSVLPEYGDPYSDRLPIYNRLDVRMRWDFASWGKDSAIILDIINALNSENVDERSLDYDKVSAPGDTPVTKDSVGLGVTPALTYRVYF